MRPDISSNCELELSVITTLYYSANYLEQFYARVSAAAKRVTSKYEIVLVNDGSPDNSLAIARDIAGRDPAVKVVELSRNFGHHIAIIPGLGQTLGTHVFL